MEQWRKRRCEDKDDAGEEASKDVFGQRQTCRRIADDLAGRAMKSVRRDVLIK